MKASLWFAALISVASSNVIAASPTTVELSVPGMDCAACPLTVRKALQAVPGVNAARVDYRTKTAQVEYDRDVVTVERLTQATANVGYPSSVTRQAGKR